MRLVKRLFKRLFNRWFIGGFKEIRRPKFNSDPRYDIQRGHVDNVVSMRVERDKRRVS